MNKSEVQLYHSFRLAYDCDEYAIKIRGASVEKWTFCQLYFFDKINYLLLLQNIPCQWNDAIFIIITTKKE